MSFSILLASVALNLGAMAIHMFRIFQLGREPSGWDKVNQALIQEKIALEVRVAELSNPERPWSYRWWKSVSAHQADAVEEWLTAHPDDSYAFERTEVSFASGSRIGIKFSTEDRNLAMLFKLAWGGAQ